MTGTAPPERGERKLRDLAQLLYVLQAIGFLVGLTSIAGVVIDDLKIDEARNTWLETHFNWQLRTVCFGLAGMALAWARTIVKIGAPTGFAVTVWAVYRVARGWLALVDRRPMYPALL